MPTTTVRRTAAIAKSGLKRYPKEIIGSLRRGYGGAVTAGGASGGDLRSVVQHRLSAAWLGHASVLFHMGGPGGTSVLTDPVFSHRVGLRIAGVTFGIPRLTPAPCTAADLPGVDLILLSHAHFDHLDRPTLKSLASARTTVVTARRTSRFLPRGFGRVIELDWGSEVEVDGVVVSAIRPAHWGARFGCDRHRGFNSYVVEHRGSGGRVLFGGDTAKTDVFGRVGAVDLAIFGIGAYEPWIHRHANPEQVWEMFKGLGGGAGFSGHLMPMHHSTFKLGEEGVDEPLRRLLAAAGEHGDLVVGRRAGEVWSQAAGAAERRAPGRVGGSAESVARLLRA